MDCNPDNSEVCSFPFALKSHGTLGGGLGACAPTRTKPKHRSIGHIILIHKLSLSLEKLVNLQNEKYFFLF